MSGVVETVKIQDMVCEATGSERDQGCLGVLDDFDECLLESDIYLSLFYKNSISSIIFFSPAYSSLSEGATT